MRINEYAKETNLKDSDSYIIDTNNGTYQVSGGDIKKYINDNRSAKELELGDADKTKEFLNVQNEDTGEHSKISLEDLSHELKIELPAALYPKGSVNFGDLPSLSSAKSGDMYNIKDDFTTTADFREGSGIDYPLGSNVYKTEDDQWDVLAGPGVIGIKIESQNDYSKGLVEFTGKTIIRSFENLPFPNYTTGNSSYFGQMVGIPAINKPSPGSDTWNAQAGIVTPDDIKLYVARKMLAGVGPFDDEYSYSTPFKLGIDSNGNYGYIKDGADTVTPFLTKFLDTSSATTIGDAWYSPGLSNINLRCYRTSSLAVGDIIVSQTANFSVVNLMSTNGTESHATSLSSNKNAALIPDVFKDIINIAAYVITDLVKGDCLTYICGLNCPHAQYSYAICGFLIFSSDKKTLKAIL